ncbi:MAG: hypothetical protein ACPGVC_08465 [Salibacteraceae bacterium]
MARTIISVLTEETWLVNKLVFSINTANYTLGYNGSNETEYIEYLQQQFESNHILFVKPVESYKKAFYAPFLQKFSKIDIIIIGPPLSPAQVGIVQLSNISGYINELDIDPPLILNIIKQLYRHGYFANHQIPEQYWTSHPKPLQILPQPKLTKREKQILDLVCHNYSTSEIAMFIETKTSNVRNVISRLRSKTFTRTNEALVALSIASGWVKINCEKFKSGSPFIRNIANN